MYPFSYSCITQAEKSMLTKDTCNPGNGQDVTEIMSWLKDNLAAVNKVLLDNMSKTLYAYGVA